MNGSNFASALGVVKQIRADLGVPALDCPVSDAAARVQVATRQSAAASDEGVHMAANDMLS